MKLVQFLQILFQQYVAQMQHNSDPYLYYFSCKGQSIFTVPQWKCANGQKIPVSLVCDGISQCQDRSDEGQRCKGRKSNYVILWLGVYFFVGIVLVGLVIFCFFNRNHKQTSDLEDKEVNPIIEDYLNEDLIQSFTKRRNFQTSILSEKDKIIIKEHYLRMKSQDKIPLIFSLLQTCGDKATCEMVILFLVSVEQEVRNWPKDNTRLVRWYWSKTIPDHELSSWVFSHVSQGVSYKIGRWFYIHAFPLYVTWMYFEKDILPALMEIYKLTSVMIDLWKDLALYFVLQHFSNLKVVSKYVLTTY